MGVYFAGTAVIFSVFLAAAMADSAYTVVPVAVVSALKKSPYLVVENNPAKLLIIC